MRTIPHQHADRNIASSAPREKQAQFHPCRVCGARMPCACATWRSAIEHLQSTAALLERCP